MTNRERVRLLNKWTSLNLPEDTELCFWYCPYYEAEEMVSKLEAQEKELIGLRKELANRKEQSRHED